MRYIFPLVLTVLITSCTSRVAMLQTTNPNSQEFRFIFGKMLLNYDDSDSLSFDESMVNYEKQLNFVLQKDSNTNGCSIVPKSITFGEPGSTGGARVYCANAIRLQIQNGLYTREGTPIYFYQLLD